MRITPLCILLSIFNAENGLCEAINSYEHIERVNDVLRGFEKSVESQGIRITI